MNLTESPPASPLATEVQRDAEQLALRIVESPAVKAAAARMREELTEDPVAQTADGADWLGRAIGRWSLSLALREAGADVYRPGFVWAIDDSPRRWFDHDFPGSSVGGVANPDNVYRSAFIDGSERYEVSGRRHDNGPETFSLELARQTPGELMLAPPEGKLGADLGDQLGILTNSDLELDADGSFTITVGPDPAEGRPNHLQTPTGRLSLTHRNTLSDWRQTPDSLEIALVGDPAEHEPPSEQSTIDAAAEDLAGYIRFWTPFRRTFLGAPAPNDISEVFPRDGGWGFAAGGRYALADDEALVITTRSGGSAYTGFQITDPWMMLPDMRIHQGSLNSAQVTADADGRLTYVIAVRDPGVANWIDTGGHPEGWYMLRWQDVTEKIEGSELVESARVLKLSDLDRDLRPEVARISPEQRQDVLQERAAEYVRRIGQ
jgi:hypothetical protein